MSGVVLLLPGGDEVSSRRPSARAAAASVRGVGPHGSPARDARTGLAVHVVHYRYRGWNGSEAHLAARRDLGRRRDRTALRRRPRVPGRRRHGRAGGAARGRARGRQLRAGDGALAAGGGHGGPARTGQAARGAAGADRARHERRAHATPSCRSGSRRGRRRRTGTCAGSKCTPTATGCTSTAPKCWRWPRTSSWARCSGGRSPGRCEDALAAPPPLGLRMPLAAGSGGRYGA